MTRDLPGDLWKSLTSTVGLVCARDARIGTTNVMAAEWSYFVNKQPLYLAVVLGPRAVTGSLITAAGEFSVTLCAEDQAGIADFAGSFSVADVDKTGSELLRFGTPEATRTPWITGGVLAVECELRQTVPLPVHTAYFGEVVTAHLPERPARPLVKHGAMHTLGAPARRSAVVTAAERTRGDRIRVAATCPDQDTSVPWRISLLDADGVPTPLGTHHSTSRGDLLVDVVLPAGLGARDLHGHRVVVERAGAESGSTRISVVPR
ncbi:flavin reductase family protein [Streptomyces sp. NPDC057621]|uniref:flavin reductase family protein n=1 Tax=Streptomyces sp. NPDC057621 TaxID=3346186 RepID=UPI00367E4F64